MFRLELMMESWDVFKLKTWRTWKKSKKDKKFQELNLSKPNDKLELISDFLVMRKQKMEHVLKLFVKQQVAL